jgi:uncharacterized protein YndB with AHSA1/START domain
MSETSAAIPALVLRRTYKTTPERLFAAWTTPEIATTFLGPDDTRIGDIRMDVRPGGAYSITMVLANGERWSVTGVYREVNEPERLSMTWRWEEENPADEIETLLTLEFNDLGAETELVLTHEQFAGLESRERHQNGWTLILDQLSGVA